MLVTKHCVEPRRVQGNQSNLHLLELQCQWRKRHPYKTPQVQGHFAPLWCWTGRHADGGQLSPFSELGNALRLPGPALQHISLGQEWLHNLQGRGKNKNAGARVQKLLRILRGGQQSVKQGGALLHRSQAHEVYPAAGLGSVHSRGLNVSCSLFFSLAQRLKEG